MNPMITFHTAGVLIHFWYSRSAKKKWAEAPSNDRLCVDNEDYDDEYEDDLEDEDDRSVLELQIMYHRALMLFHAVMFAITSWYSSNT